ncbi:sugar transferase [Faecalibaculum rodentium]|jgi:lipopolysaccharide/colanic/teichoic acid biosynthesis glycosyltransferase/glycosyltransferase involved in cell wall biosynthesis/nucleoside-diphosphate-sugar epimerase|uniref:sugar transferase n=1 Tax=Faecalibaculum rodentium TaxID=1702221 RepID=UPI001C3D4F51|nr:sugar transferase [Faecalibaculum rodentium]
MANAKKVIATTAAILGATYVILDKIAVRQKPDSNYDNQPDQKNPFEGKKVVFVESQSDGVNADGIKGHLEATGDIDSNQDFYVSVVKRGLDKALAFGGLVVLSPVLAGIALAIKLEDPGPVLFTQKRVGENKKFFKLHKFRSMKMDTPHDVPTHMLENPNQYITKVGKFLRAHSLDELPQIWDIFLGNMSVIGPRPALWNQNKLTALRDQYGANNIKPGLTGWAQINGRDEIELEEKARLDGEYVRNAGLAMDAKCFLGSIHVFGKDDSVVEGGTGAKKDIGSRHYIDGKSDEELIGNIGFGEPVKVDTDRKVKILIVGKESYIGQSLESYADKYYPENFTIDTVDTLPSASGPAEWETADFSCYDVVFHVAGLAHADVGKVSEEIKEKYYQVNTDLAINVAKKAKSQGVGKFIFMSSMIVYGESAPIGTDKVITADSVPNPANYYGDSKLQADVAIRGLSDKEFKVIVLRPPMIYGKGSKGNYPKLSKIAKSIPIFPNIQNQRSMLYIENLCEFLCQILLVQYIGTNSIVLFPQNSEWVQTSQMVKEVAKVWGKNICLIRTLGTIVFFGSKLSGRVSDLINKAFGSSCYQHELSIYDGINYQIIDIRESINRTENIKRKTSSKSKALMLASVASMIEQFNMQNIQILLDHGYDVDVICNCKDGNTISNERIDNFIKQLNNEDVSVIHSPIPRKVSDIRLIKKSLNQVKKLCDNTQYEIIHCHSPIGSVIARIASLTSRRKYGTKVIYTVHGFHFYKGAPVKNWAVFYPIEKFCSRLTDILITINTEDYVFAKKHMYTKRIEYIPGVGIDTKSFDLTDINMKSKRDELNISLDDFMIISVGELNKNKNHEIMIRAIARVNNPKIHYFIAGIGQEEQHLKKLANNLGVNLHLLGYRSDIKELLNIANLYAFPSYREGLSVALMEAMAAGLPCIVSKIRGNIDLIDEGKGGILCSSGDVREFSNGIRKIISNGYQSKKMGLYNKNKIKNYDNKIIADLMENIYFE